MDAKQFSFRKKYSKMPPAKCRPFSSVLNMPHNCIMQIDEKLSHSFHIRTLIHMLDIVTHKETYFASEDGNHDA